MVCRTVKALVILCYQLYYEFWHDFVIYLPPGLVGPAHAWSLLAVQKEAKIYQNLNAKKPKFIANSFLIVLSIDTVQLLFYNQCDD